MAEISKRSVSEFNNNLKLKGFNIFQIEADGSATRTYSRKDFYKICLTTGKSKIIMPTAVLKRKEPFCSSEILTFPIPGKHCLPSMLAIPAFFLKNSGMPVPGLKVFRTRHYLNLAAPQYLKFQKSRDLF